MRTPQQTLFELLFLLKICKDNVLDVILMDRRIHRLYVQPHFFVDRKIMKNDQSIWTSSNCDEMHTGWLMIFLIRARLYEVEQFSLACVLAKEAADTVTECIL